jgi:uncharacterized membrane protein (DUF485 family)
LILFSVYFLTYAGFICLAVLSTESLGAEVFLGVNLAIVYGVALIALALILAIIYMWLCRRVERNGGDGSSEEP